MKLKMLLEKAEGQQFDRKSIRIEPKALAIPIVAFANADGGDIVIGVSDMNKKIEGVDYDAKKVNDLLRVPFDFCVPTVKVSVEKVACIDYLGRKNHVIVMHVEPSMYVHANQADEVYLRVGDQSKKMSFEERIQLLSDKGERLFEDRIVEDATIDDLDRNFVNTYIKKIGYSKSIVEYLCENKGFVKDVGGRKCVSSAAILLFGKNPQLYFPRARIRFIRYDGIEEKFGREMNVIKDVIFEGNLLKQINDAVSFLDTQIKEKTYLGNDGRFVTEVEYPKFVRQELVVNAVTHRDYSILGTDIQIKMFDDRIVVESPGKLPGLVRTDNIRHTHFSRNPKIAEFLKAYDFVKEYGEGVDRMHKELAALGMSGPRYISKSFVLHTIIYNESLEDRNLAIEDRNLAIEDRNLAIEDRNLAIEDRNLAIEDRNLAIEDRNLAIEDRNLAIEDRNLAIEDRNLAIDENDIHKLSIDVVKDRLNVANYRMSTCLRIITVYEMMETNQVFSTMDIVSLLNCSSATSRVIVSKMKLMGIICEVLGLGKGRYRFVNEDEIE